MATRPAANLLDIILLSEFGEILYIPYIILTLMYLAFVFLLRKQLAYTGIKTGSLFMLIVLLCPLNIEATVWVSAASRITVGLFLTTVGIWIITPCITRKRLILFSVINLISFLFYEQTVFFSLLLTLSLTHSKKNYTPLAIAGVNAILTGIYYYALKNYGVFSHRLSGLGTFDIRAFANGIKHCLSACFFTLISGKIFSVPIALIPTYYIFKKSHCTAFCPKKLILGTAIALTTLIPVMITGLYELPFRCLAIPLIGVGLAADCIKSKKIYRITSGILALVFISSAISEFKKYDLSTEADQQLIKQISAVASDNPNKTLGVFGVKKHYYSSPENHSEHISAITSSDWALTGAVRSQLKNPHYPLISMDKEADINIYLNDKGTEIYKIK